MDDKLALQLQHDLAAKLSKTGSNGIVIDFTAVKVVDSFIAKVICDTAYYPPYGFFFGCNRPKAQVALTLVDLGIDLPGVKAALNLKRN